MDRFNRPSTYNKKNAFSKVIFGYKLPPLEVELNELQDIQNEKVKALLSSIIGDGVIEGATFSYSEGTLTVNAVALVKGYFITLENATLSLAEGEKAYIKVREIIVGGHSTIKDYGNVNGQDIENKILDTDIGIETTKRVQVQFELVKDNSDGNYMYLELGTVTNSSFNLSAFTFKNNEKVGQMITGILSSIDELSKKISEEGLSNSGLAQELNKVKDSVAEVSNAIGLNNGKITSIEANIQGIISTINAINSSVSSNSSQIVSAKENISQNTSSINTVKQKVQSVEGGVQVNSKAIADLGGRVASTESTVSGLGAKVQQNTSLANSAKAKAEVNAQEIEKVKQNTYNKSEVDSKDARTLADAKSYADVIKGLLDTLTNNFNGHNHDTRYFRKNLGCVGTDITDFNNCLDEGQYDVSYGGSSPFPNAPINGIFFGTLIVYVNDGTKHNNKNNWIWQILYTTTGDCFWRYKINNENWNQWRKNYDTKNKPTPSDIGAYTKGEVDSRDSNVLASAKSYTDGVKNNLMINTLMRVDAPSDRDCNSFTRVNSFFAFDTGAGDFRNTPLGTLAMGTAKVFVVKNIGYSTSRLLQEFTLMYDDSNEFIPRKFIRSYRSEQGWSEWTMIYTQRNKPTASDIGTYTSQQIDNKFMTKKAIAHEGDINTLVTGGFYAIRGANAKNIPIPSDGYLLVMPWDNEKGWATQIFVDDVTCKTYIRTVTQVDSSNRPTGWSSWAKMYTSVDKPTPQELNLYTKGEVDTKDSNTLRDAKSYSDTKLQEAKQHASTTANQSLVSAKSYSDTKLQEAKQYANGLNSQAMSNISAVNEVAVNNQREVQGLKTTLQSQGQAIQSINGSLSTNNDAIAGLRATANSNDRRIGVLETEFNGKANKFNPQPIWEGIKQLSEYDTITPEKPLSDCNIGWLLVWSDADNMDYPNNFNYATTLIPRLSLIVGSGNFFCTVPSNEDGTIIVKTIYITNSQIKGFEGNNKGNKADVVLRQVIAI